MTNYEYKIELGTDVGRIISRYNPENDCIPNGPRVTWAEYNLAEAVRILAKGITELQEEIEVLKSKGGQDE